MAFTQTKKPHTDLTVGIAFKFLVRVALIEAGNHDNNWYNTIQLSFDIALLTGNSEMHLHASAAQMQLVLQSKCWIVWLRLRG